MNAVTHPLPDIQGRPEIERLVNAFYEKVRADDRLGFIFTDIAHTDWAAHLPRMHAFWETVLFGTGGFAGNPVTAHAKLVPRTEMGRAQFDRWLLLFERTVDELFHGERADHIKNCARDMANVLHGRIHGMPGAHSGPARLTPAQRARCAAGRAAPAA